MSHPLDGFKAAASIDFITIAQHAELPPVDSHLARRSLPTFDGTYELPNRERVGHASWLTVHDPSTKDVQTLIDRFYDAELTGLEVSVDFARPGVGDPARNRDLYLWLRHSIAPQKHAQMTRLRRRQFDDTTGKYRRLKRGQVLSNNNTFIWENANSWMLTRLYLKKKLADRRCSTPYEVVRLEASLRRGGTQNALVHRVGLLPLFIPELRRYVSPMLSVGKAFQRPLVDIRPHRIHDFARRARAERTLERQAAALARRWQKQGAGAGIERGIAVYPDSVANKVIGNALKRLSESLRGLKEPGKVADYPRWAAHHAAWYRVFPDGRPTTYRGELP